MEKLDKERYLKRVIVVCWIALAICFGIKLFGGNLFEIMCHNENFIKVCEYADNHFWAYFGLASIFSIANTYFFTLAIIQEIKFNKWQLLVVILTVIIGNIIKSFNDIAGLFFDVWQAIIMPAVFTIKEPRKHKNILIANGLLLVFQFISLITRNIGLKFLSNTSALISMIFNVDLIIMVVLYYLYSNLIKRKENV
jgi:hypothetical protein